MAVRSHGAAQAREARQATRSHQRTVRQGRPPAGRTERRGWLSQGLAALAVSALGLAVAGSLPQTSDAQTTPLIHGPSTSVPGPVLSAPGTASPAPTPVAPDPSLAAFARRDAAAGPTRSAAVRVAITREQAAQRSEELAKAAEQITRATLTQNSDARQQDLSKAELARQTTAAQLAAENLRRAVAARLAAAAARQEAEVQNPADPAAIPIPAGAAGVSPVPNAVVGAHFGQRGLWSRYHTGLDFRASYGTPIRAVQAGVVLYAGNSGDWAGNHVAVKHADGITTMYSHMSSMAARAGDTVQAGQVIGYVGQTGRAFGAHLHFEVYPVGVKYGDVYRAVNPQPWLAANGVHTR